MPIYMKNFGFRRGIVRIVIMCWMLMGFAAMGGQLVIESFQTAQGWSEFEGGGRRLCPQSMA